MLYINIYIYSWQKNGALSDNDIALPWAYVAVSHLTSQTISEGLNRQCKYVPQRREKERE